MNIWDHLTELRRRLIICLGVFGVGLIFGAAAVDPILAWLAKPMGELVFIYPLEAFSAQMKLAAWVSLLLSLPVWIYQALSFAAAGLTPRERRYILWAVPGSYLAFMAGAAFSTWVLFPKAVEFLVTFRSARLTPMLSVEAYLNFFIVSGLLCGILFQMPLIFFFLAKMGVVRSETLARQRRVCYLAIFVMASLLNPGVDIFTQLALAGVGVLLFEAALVFMRWAAPPRT